MKFNFIIVFFLLGSIFPSLVHAQKTPVSVDVPLHHWSYDVMDRLVARGLVDIYGVTSKPYTRRHMAKMTEQAVRFIQRDDLDQSSWGYLESLEDDIDKLVDEFREELISLGLYVLQGKEQPKKTSFRIVHPLRLERVLTDLSENETTELRNRRGWALKEGGNLRASVRAWGKVEDLAAFAVEPAYYRNRDEDHSLFEEAYFRFHLYDAEITVGRQSLWWGAGFNGSLILTDNAPALDMVRVRNVNPMRLPSLLNKLGALDVSMFISELDDNRAVEQPKLAGLRLTLTPSSYLSIGFSRTVMMGGNRGNDHLSAEDVAKGLLVPKESEAFEANNNQITMIDLLWRWRGMLFYGQYAGDGEDKGGFEDSAYLVGVHMPDILNRAGLALKVEYAQNENEGGHNWYSHSLYRDGYTHKGSVLGHFMGGDANNLTIRLSQERALKGVIAVGLQYDVTQRGLSLHNTETRRRYTVDAELFRTSFISAQFAYTFEDIENRHNLHGDHHENHIIELIGKASF